MTTLSITSHPQTRIHLTRRGRRVIAALAAVPVLVAVGVAAMNGGAALAFSVDDVTVSAQGSSFASVTVAAGESLWSIAETIAPSADPRDVVDAIVRLNALESASVGAGQRLAIPMEYSPVQ